MSAGEELWWETVGVSLTKKSRQQIRISKQE